MVLSDSAKSGLESGARVDGYDFQNKDKTITITKNTFFFRVVYQSKNHAIPNPVTAAILVVDHLMSYGMRFPTIWYVRPAKAQTSLRISAV